MTTQAIRLAHTANMTREDWLTARRKGIGSSDAAAVCGLNPYESPVSLWMDKTGRKPLDNEQSEPAYWGTVLEPVIADEFAKRTEKRVRRCNYILQHSDYPWMLANLDREIVGENAILECKCASAWLSDQWEGDNAPLPYVIQVQHALAVTGASHGYFATLIGGNDFRHYRIERDEVLIENLIRLERDFWQGHVLTDEMPLADGSGATTDALRTIHNAPEGEIELAPDAAALFRQYDEAKADESEAARRKKQASNRLAQLLGDYRAGTYPIGDKVRKAQWVPRKGNVNWGDVLADHDLQGIDTDAYRGEPSRSLRIS